MLNKSAGLAVLGVALLLETAANPPAVSGLPRPASSKLCPRVEFDGEVTAGKSFRKPIGDGLSLVLEAVPHGWIIRILPTTGSQPEQDFAEVVTPPFHSVNPLLLTTDFGFRAQDVVGWNPRNIRFAETTSEFAEAQQAYRAVVSSKRPTPEQEQAVTRAAMRAQEGQIVLLDAVLVPGTGDQTPGAALVATHFAATAHQIRSSVGGSTSPLGQVLSLRFHASLSAPRGVACRRSK